MDHEGTSRGESSCRKPLGVRVVLATEAPDWRVRGEEEDDEDEEEVEEEEENDQDADDDGKAT